MQKRNKEKQKDCMKNNEKFKEIKDLKIIEKNKPLHRINVGLYRRLA